MSITKRLDFQDQIRLRFFQSSTLACAVRHMRDRISPPSLAQKQSHPAYEDILHSCEASQRAPNLIN